jgi:hypothetical protein
VPPPPVAGAAVGNGVSEWRGAADWRGVAEALADGRGVADVLAEGLSLALGVLELAEPLGRTLGVAEPAPADENGVGVGEGEDVVQAETEAEATMAKVAQQAAANLELRPVPMMVERIVTGPPYRPAGVGPFPGPGIGREIVADRSLPAPSRRQIPGSADGHKSKAIDGTGMKWPVHHWNIRLRD